MYFFWTKDHRAEFRDEEIGKDTQVLSYVRIHFLFTWIHVTII